MIASGLPSQNLFTHFCVLSHEDRNNLQQYFSGDSFFITVFVPYVNLCLPVVWHWNDQGMAFTRGTWFRLRLCPHLLNAHIHIVFLKVEYQSEAHKHSSSTIEDTW